MIDPDFFLELPELATANLRLVALGPEHLAGSWATHRDPETRRLAGIHSELTEHELAARIEARRRASDRADWAIIRSTDNAYVGEVSLRDFDPDNESMDFHIELGNPALFGQGYGSEATKAVVDFGLGVVHLHRITLQVVDFNTRAQRLYAKIGFHPEGLLREAWLWDGERSDVIVMAIVAGH